MARGHDNPSFSDIPDSEKFSNHYIINNENDSEQSSRNAEDENDRDQWGKGIQFTLSCIACCVGLGNVWRFPFIALQNGGGAFVIPYIIMLLLVGRPGYFLEMIMGQFSSRGTIKVYDCAPAMRGVGMGQMVTILAVSTYYSSILAIALRYFFYSFNTVLPWSECKPEWTEPCYSANGIQTNDDESGNITRKSSTELYFLKEVLHARENINDGIGSINWNLFGFLALTWITVCLILMRGVRSSGKAAYITGIVPFIFLFIFLIRALTLPGAFNGIAFFFTPKWEDILKPGVWYAAVTQLFFSLNVFFANIIMYASYNKFSHKIHRDSNIITIIDTGTSLLAGCISFGIIGHLAHELGVDDISKVFQGGPGLVFVTYAETISKFRVLPQVFSVLFFLMLYILGLGSLIAQTSCVITVIRDQFKNVKNWHAAVGYSIFGALCGSLYTTEGGQSVLNLVDHYGTTFVNFLLAVFEIMAFCHIYGVNRICKDVKFMLGFIPGIYWTVCWRVVTPLIMMAIIVYHFIYYENPKDNGAEFPFIAHVVGWCITASGLIWLPLIIIWSISKQNEKTFVDRVKSAFRPTKNWGPLNSSLLLKYQEFLKTN
ncbi:hypothetical protein PVAND_000021 [Polypedilum vanderplanki]|uniref:Transporter n=1 Tax=Polypedilum vanderplanki TaxID=319348 RepID=A0A9J6BK17_POLVA|nr:hypothetical protein PVAND_000021 [Polypedilum vanderplanki]